MATLTIYYSSDWPSGRLLMWLCEELTIPYDVKTHYRSGIVKLRDVLLPSGETLALGQTSACVEHIFREHGHGYLMLPPSHPEYADFIFWWQWANRVWLSSIRGKRILTMRKHPPVLTKRIAAELEGLNERLMETPYLAGKTFTVADMMVLESLKTLSTRGFSLAEYDGIPRFIARAEARAPYQNHLWRLKRELEGALMMLRRGLILDLGLGLGLGFVFGNAFWYGYHVPRTEKRDNFYRKLEEERAAKASA
ncbi:hypothetical protein QBC39DRAFT_375601 [Podospora conica]|nr:hypothetical protein QBC39DRAFT_375601 [Schizothecium conicum]